jgi:glucan 1,3-beta-glucosidase
MSYTNDPPNNIAYDPIPDEHPPTDIPYNAPIHEPPSLSYGTPQPGSSELIHDDDLPPSGVAPPRFFGSALYSEVGAPGTRNSHYSSPSQAPTIRGSVYSGSGSVYALNTRPYDSQVFEDGYRDDPYLAGNQGGMSLDPVGRNRYLQEKNATYARPTAFPRRRVIYWIAFIIILLIVAVGLPVYFAVIRPKENSSGSGSHSTAGAPPSSTGKPGKSNAITGGDGSTVTMEDGTTFIYKNSFGGFWYDDPNDPFNNGAQAQSWTPALNETFNYGSDRIRGSVH